MSKSLIIVVVFDDKYVKLFDPLYCFKPFKIMFVKMNKDCINHILEILMLIKII